MATTGIAYKVVRKWKRYGTNLTIYESLASKQAQVKKLLKEHSNLFPTYHKGATVHKASGTEGLFIFLEKRRAEEFIEWELPHRPVKIIKVKPLSEVHKPKKVFCHIGNTPYRLVSWYEHTDLRILNVRKAPYGSYVCDSLLVLE